MARANCAERIKIVRVGGEPDPADLILDCDGGSTGGQRVLTLQNKMDLGVCLEVPFVDSGDGCTPAAPSAKLAGFNLRTENTDCDQFKWDGTAWALTNLSQNTGYCALNFDGVLTPGQASPIGATGFSLNDAQLAAWNATNATAYADVFGLSKTLTNDDKVPWKLQGRMRAVHSPLNVGSGNRFGVQWTTGPSDTAEAVLSGSGTKWLGATPSSIDVVDDPNYNHESGFNFFLHGFLDPGIQWY